MRILTWLPGRLLGAAVVLVGASALIFAAVRFLPGDYAQIVLGPLASAQEREALRTEFGFDRTVGEQYLLWLGQAVTGNFGHSLASGQPVAGELAARLPVTALLTAMAVVWTVVIGVPLGILAGTRTGTTRSTAAGRLVSSLGVSVPDYVLAAVVVFALSSLPLGPSVGAVGAPAQDLGGTLLALLPPSLVLAVFTIAATARATRDAVLNVLVEPHVSAAVARGETRLFIITHHVLRNAAVPVLTLTGTITAMLLGGAVIVESVFDVSGLGSYLVQGLGRRDYPVIQTCVLLATTVFVLMSLIVDVVTGLLDPRVAVSGRSR
ncbi:ABC transporter permease [Nocardiopsis sp. FIRDI 009]|uniref:ABC transporter permease n=1 Tax=Nocardiopsis sp. FIRDI 009 TaxID=714197 RepID=UPI000E27BAA2|nr:ABC transporter permease [Nocardiopsis sp. FIRDI 009]